ncbi:MAG: BTAD domain-containing putative transcriptional regulator [Thermodesulfobacteriota bacterium]
MSRLEQARDKRLVLILGQAAQGKTSLAACHVQDNQAPCAWINLDASDADPVNLFHCLARAAALALPGCDPAPLLHASAVCLGPRDPKALHLEWLAGLHALAPPPMDYVLDGLDRLEPHAAAFGFIDTFLEFLPVGSRAVLLSRSMPPLEIERLRMSQDVLILSNQDLALDEQEVKDFLSLKGFKVGKREAAALRRISEGWIGGLVLLAESRAAGRENAAPSLDILEAGEALRANSRGYFAEQVLARQPPALQRFLLETSLLELVEPRLAARLTGMDDAPELLEDLAGRNLFVARSHDPVSGWAYRYHLAFRDFLQAELRARAGREGLAAVLVRAALACQAEERPEEALNLYLRAGAEAPAVQIIRRLAPGLLMEGRGGDLAHWLGALSPATLEADPWLSLHLCQTRRWTGMAENLACLPAVVERLRSLGDARGQLAGLTCLLEAAIMAGAPPRLSRQLAAQASALLEDQATDGFPLDQAGLYLMVGMHHIVTDDPRRGHGACQRALLLAQRHNVALLKALAVYWSAHAMTGLGEYQRAHEYLDEMDRQIQSLKLTEMTTLSLLSRSRLQCFQGRLDLARQNVELAGRNLERHGQLGLYPGYVLFRLWALVMDGRPGEAEAFLAEARAVAPPFSPYYLRMCLLGIAIGHYRLGDFVQAGAWVRKALEASSELDENDLPYAPEFENLPAMIDYHLGNAEAKTLAKAQRSLERARLIGSHHLEADTLLTLALYEHRAGRREEAAALLRSGFGIYAQWGYDFSPSLSRADMARLCALALDMEADAAWETATRLLTSSLADLAPAELDRLRDHPNPVVRTKSVELGGRLRRAGLPVLHLRTLGGFEARLGDTVMAGGKAWGGAQAPLLLKALLAHGGRKAPRDVLMEALWPEAPAAAAENSFKVALHRLRRALEPDLGKEFGSAYVQMENNLVSLDADLCHVDVGEFRRLLDQGRELEAAGDAKGAIERYRRGAELYRGDFLAQDLYLVWAEAPRRRLKEDYVDLLLRLAGLHERLGALGKAAEACRKAIAADPCQEQAYQRLMAILDGRGQRSQAIQVYEQCRRALQAELAAEPDPLTTALYRRLLSQA